MSHVLLNQALALRFKDLAADDRDAANENRKGQGFTTDPQRIHNGSTRVPAQESSDDRADKRGTCWFRPAFSYEVKYVVHKLPTMKYTMSMLTAGVVPSIGRVYCGKPQLRVPEGGEGGALPHCRLV